MSSRTLKGQHSLEEAHLVRVIVSLAFHHVAEELHPRQQLHALFFQKVGSFQAVLGWLGSVFRVFHESRVACLFL